ncbi:major facilitator superfamily protein [Streptomyces albus]|nr:major facilitator superfamily protein [Streptomyces albus]
MRNRPPGGPGHPPRAWSDRLPRTRPDRLPRTRPDRLPRARLERSAGARPDRSAGARPDRTPRVYLGGAASARTGDELCGPALLLTALAVTGSAARASGLLAALTAAAALGGPLLGALLDRSARPGRLLALALGGHAAALLLLLVSLGRAPFVLSAALAGCAGLLGPALSGGWTSQLPRLVSPEDLARANARDAMTFQFAALAGPALAGTAAALAGAPYGVLLAALLIGAAAPVALRLPPRGGASGGRPGEQSRTRPEGRTPDGTAVCPPGTAAQLPADLRDLAPRPALPGRVPRLPSCVSDLVPSRTPPRLTAQLPSVFRHLAPIRRLPGLMAQLPVCVRALAAVRTLPDLAARFRVGARAKSATWAPPGLAAELRAGVRALGATRALARATAASVCGCAGEGAFLACVPLLGAAAFGAPGRGAYLLTAAALVSLLSNALLARRASLVRPELLLFWTPLALAAACLLAATGVPLLLLAAVLPLGAAGGPQLTALFAVRHRDAPHSLHAQVFTTGASLKITGFAAGTGLAGLLATFSVPAALLAAAALHALGALVCLPLLTRRGSGRTPGGTERAARAPESGPAHGS